MTEARLQRERDSPWKEVILNQEVWHHRPEAGSGYCFCIKQVAVIEPSPLGNICVSSKQRTVWFKINTSQPTQNHCITKVPSLYATEPSLCGMQMVELLEEESKSSSQQPWGARADVGQRGRRYRGLRVDQTNISQSLTIFLPEDEKSKSNNKEKESYCHLVTQWSWVKCQGLLPRMHKLHL